MILFDLTMHYAFWARHREKETVKSISFLSSCSKEDQIFISTLGLITNETYSDISVYEKELWHHRGNKKGSLRFDIQGHLLRIGECRRPETYDIYIHASHSKSMVCRIINDHIVPISNSICEFFVAWIAFAAIRWRVFCEESPGDLFNASGDEIRTEMVNFKSLIQVILNQNGGSIESSFWEPEYSSLVSDIDSTIAFRRSMGKR